MTKGDFIKCIEMIEKDVALITRYEDDKKIVDACKKDISFYKESLLRFYDRNTEEE